MRITKSQALRIGNKLKVNWNKVDLEQLRQGISIESEHKNVVGNSMTAWAKVALAHLKEKRNYYSLLKKVER
jgi:hypothetical protein